MKRTFLGLVVAGGMVFGMAGAVSAGEYNGNGDPVPGGPKGKSECSYSGRDLVDSLENNPPGFDDDELFARGVQSYGQIVSQGLKAFFPSPGQACRGNL